VLNLEMARPPFRSLRQVVRFPATSRCFEFILEISQTALGSGHASGVGIYPGGDPVLNSSLTMFPNFIKSAYSDGL